MEQRNKSGINWNTHNWSIYIENSHFPKALISSTAHTHNICLLDNSNNINNKWTNTYGTTKLIAWTPAKGHYNHIPNHFQGPARQRKSEKNGQSKTYSGHFEFLSRFQHVVPFPLLQFGQCWFPARLTQIQAVLSIWMLIKNIYIYWRTWAESVLASVDQTDRRLSKFSGHVRILCLSILVQSTAPPRSSSPLAIAVQSTSGGRDRDS